MSDLPMPDAIEDPSEFLRAVADDIEWALKHEDIQFDAFTWVSGQRHGGVDCRVCAAGAMIVRRINSGNIRQSDTPSSCSGSERERRLLAYVDRAMHGEWFMLLNEWIGFHRLGFNTQNALMETLRKLGSTVYDGAAVAERFRSAAKILRVAFSDNAV